MPIELERESKEFGWWPIDAANPEDVTLVEVALILNPLTRPVDVDFIDAILVDPAHSTMGDGVNWWMAILLSGTGQGGTIALAPGDYQAWGRATSPTERPVRRIGVVTIL